MNLAANSVDERVNRVAVRENISLLISIFPSDSNITFSFFDNQKGRLSVSKLHNRPMVIDDFLGCLKVIGEGGLEFLGEVHGYFFCAESLSPKASKSEGRIPILKKFFNEGLVFAGCSSVQNVLNRQVQLEHLLTLIWFEKIFLDGTNKIMFLLKAILKVIQCLFVNLWHVLYFAEESLVSRKKICNPSVMDL